MNVLKTLVKTYIYVLAGSILSTAIFISVFVPETVFTVLLLWEVIVMSAATTLGTLIFYSKKEISKRQMKIRTVIHYIYINLIVFSTALLCGWVDLKHTVQLLFLLLLIAAVYYSVSSAMFKKEEKAAECMNERLREIYPEEDEGKW